MISYANYFKFIDKKEIIQEDYKDIKQKKQKLDKSFKLTDENKKMMKQAKIETKTMLYIA